MIKALIPKKVKLLIRLTINLIKDLIAGYWFSFAKKRKKPFNAIDKIELTQRLKPNKAKVHNLKIAIQSIQSVQIMPNEIFSFWRIVGNPSKKNGFIESRSIVGNKIESSVGGGLCQLSGLVYYLSILSNLEIIERYNHSIDIYTDETRFTPLGSDAAVAYGYKDLKIRNNSKNPIYFTFLVGEENLSIQLNHGGDLKSQQVDFTHKHINTSKIEVDTMVNNRVINTSSYKTLAPM